MSHALASSSSTKSWRPPTRRATAAPSVSVVFGIPEHAVPTTSAASTLKPSPLRHQLSRQSSGASIRSRRSSISSGKRRQSIVQLNPSPVKIDETPDAVFARPSPRHDMDQTPGAGPSTLPSTVSDPVVPPANEDPPPASTPSTSTAYDNVAHSSEPAPSLTKTGWFTLRRKQSSLRKQPSSSTIVAEVETSRESSSANGPSIPAEEELPTIKPDTKDEAMPIDIPSAEVEPPSEQQSNESPNVEVESKPVPSTEQRASWFSSFRASSKYTPSSQPTPTPSSLHLTIVQNDLPVPSQPIPISGSPNRSSPLAPHSQPRSLPTSSSAIEAKANFQSTPSSPTHSPAHEALASAQHALSPPTGPTEPSPPSRDLRANPIASSNPSSLNPSTARYSLPLPLPLLGRPKAKLQDILPPTSEVHEGEVSTPSPRDSSFEQPTMEATGSESSPHEAASLADELTSQQSTHGRTESSAPSETSWWSYVTLRRAPEPIIADQLQSSSEPVLPLVPDDATQEPLKPSSASVPYIDEPAPPTEDPQPQEAVLESNPSAAPSSGSWLTPWLWGTSPDAAPESSAHDIPKTEAELIKEEALARPDPPPPPPPSSSIVLENPIMTQTSRSSWVSFFSSKSSVAVKTVKGPETEPEVMYLDFDEPETPTSQAPEGAKSQPTANSKASVGQTVGPPSPTRPANNSTTDGSTSHPSTPRASTPIPQPKANGSIKGGSPAPSKKGVPPPRPPNLLLPSFQDTFYTLPRSNPPRDPNEGAVQKVINRFWAATKPVVNPEMEAYQQSHTRLSHTGSAESRPKLDKAFGRELPRSWSVLGQTGGGTVKRIAVIGIHGWFPGTVMRTVFGEPTGTSSKFASMMESAVLEYATTLGWTLDKVTKIPLEGDGTIEKRVEKLMQSYLAHSEWVEDVLQADAVLFATHSQGSVVSTALIDCLIEKGHIRTGKNSEAVLQARELLTSEGPSLPPPELAQRVCCLALCGIHSGPLLYLNNSSLVQPYIQYFESSAARELFDFQDTESTVSKIYVERLGRVLKHGIKFVYVASFDDQVVPIYSAAFTSATHPLILRSLFIDGEAYTSSDFLSNFLITLFRLRNAGLDDGGIITHLSEATAGSLSGVGHSIAYEEPATYTLAVRFLFETSGVLAEDVELSIQPFKARASRNDYLLPWALRGLIEDPRVIAIFGDELRELRQGFHSWVPKTNALKDIRRKLEPIALNKPDDGSVPSSKL